MKNNFSLKSYTNLISRKICVAENSQISTLCLEQMSFIALSTTWWKFDGHGLKVRKRADSSFMMKQAYFFNSYTMLFLLATLIIFLFFFYRANSRGPGHTTSLPSRKPTIIMRRNWVRTISKQCFRLLGSNWDIYSP